MKKSSLADLEAIIESNRTQFYRIDTFEAYVKDRWDMVRSHAYRLIDASKVLDNLSPIGDGILPQNESQARALVHLKPIDQRNIWREFIESGTALSASNIRKFIKMRKKKGSTGVDPNPANLIDMTSTGYKAAVMAMLEQIRLAKNEQWQHTSRQAALYWLRVMKETILSNLSQDNTP